MTVLGPRPRDLRVPSERAVARRLTRVSTAVFLVFVLLGWASQAYVGINPALNAVVGIALLASMGGVYWTLLIRAARREIAVTRMASVFLEGLPVGVLFLDSEGRIAYCNPAVPRLVAMPASDVLQKAVRDFVPYDDQAGLLRAFERLRAGEPAVFEVRATRASGSRLQLAVTAIPFFDGGSFDGSLAVLTDLTELLEARATAERYRQLASFALDTVTHDLSNSLQVVAARAEMAASLSKDAALQRVVGGAAQAAERATLLIHEIKMIAAAEREKWPRREMPLSVLIDRAVTLAAMPSDLSIEVHIEPEAAALILQASDLAPLALAKVVEEAATPHPGRGPRPKLALHASVESASLRAAVIRVKGSQRRVSDSDLKLMLEAPRELSERDTPWREGVRLALAAAVADAQGWWLRAARGEGPDGLVFELHIPL